MYWALCRANQSAGVRRVAKIGVSSLHSVKVISPTLATSFPSITTFERVSIACITDSVAVTLAATADLSFIGVYLENSGLFR